MNSSNQTIRFKSPPVIISAASIVGPKEGEGPLSDYFDIVLKDQLNGEKSWEKAESSLARDAISLAVKKADIQMEDIDVILTGDLLDQLTGSTFGIKDFNRPFLGLFGACSTFAEASILGSIIIDGGFANNVIAAASSHFCASEKQFRFPLELGSQRPPSSSWTVTGDGAVVLSKRGYGPLIKSATVGKIIDMGIKDAANMGAAMAPAAADTLITFFKDTHTSPSDYDIIATGDLGHIGNELLEKLLKEEGLTFNNLTDCGIEIFDQKTQDTHSGGSGCACAAVTFCGYFYKKLLSGEINNMLLIPTGALFSPASSQQGETIPSIAHLIEIERN